MSAVQNQVRRQKRNAPRSLDSSLIRYAERDSIKDLTNSPIDSDRPEGQSAGRRLGPPKIDRRKTKDHEKDPKHRLGEPRVDRRKIKGYGKDYEHRPEEPKVDRRKIKEYEKKPRHKMKDPTTKKSREETRKEEARPIKKKKKKKGDVATRTKTDTLAEGFSSKHIGNQRISVGLMRRKLFYDADFWFA